MPDKKTTEIKKYIVNHNLGKIITPNGDILKFRECIKKFDFPLIQEEILQTGRKENNRIKNINLKIISLSQIKELEDYIFKIGFNPVFSIEAGEIIHPADLCKYSAEEIIKRINNFCKRYDIKLRYGTPKRLIERDFLRVFNTSKTICEQINPYSVVINNEKFLTHFTSDKDLKNVNIEIGSGINLKQQNLKSIIKNFKRIQCIDVSGLTKLEDIQNIIREAEKIIPKRKMTVEGSISVESEGLCPLNNLPPKMSRMDCSAVCQKGSYAIEDCNTNSVLPFVSDGFCQIHLYENKILDLSSYIKSFEKIGITEFTIDMSVLKKEFIPVLLTRFLNNQNITTFKEPTIMPDDTL